jgi:hypothetical protein
MGKRKHFPSSNPVLAYVRPGPVHPTRLAQAIRRLALCNAEVAQEAIAIMQEQAAYILTVENELGQVYVERNPYAS